MHSSLPLYTFNIHETHRVFLIPDDYLAANKVFSGFLLKFTSTQLYQW